MTPVTTRSQSRRRGRPKITQLANSENPNCSAGEYKVEDYTKVALSFMNEHREPETLRHKNKLKPCADSQCYWCVKRLKEADEKVLSVNGDLLSKIKVMKEQEEKELRLHSLISSQSFASPSSEIQGDTIDTARRLLNKKLKLASQKPAQPNEFPTSLECGESMEPSPPLTPTLSSPNREMHDSNLGGSWDARLGKLFRSDSVVVDQAISNSQKSTQKLPNILLLVEELKCYAGSIPIPYDDSSGQHFVGQLIVWYKRAIEYMRLNCGTVLPYTFEVFKTVICEELKEVFLNRGMRPRDNNSSHFLDMLTRCPELKELIALCPLKCPSLYELYMFVKKVEIVGTPYANETNGIPDVLLSLEWEEVKKFMNKTRLFKSSQASCSNLPDRPEISSLTNEVMEPLHDIKQELDDSNLSQKEVTRPTTPIDISARETPENPDESRIPSMRELMLSQDYEITDPFERYLNSWDFIGVNINAVMYSVDNLPTESFVSISSQTNDSIRLNSSQRLEDKRSRRSNPGSSGIPCESPNLLLRKRVPNDQKVILRENPIGSKLKLPIVNQSSRAKSALTKLVPLDEDIKPVVSSIDTPARKTAESIVYRSEMSRIPSIRDLMLAQDEEKTMPLEEGDLVSALDLMKSIKNEPEDSDSVPVLTISSSVDVKQEVIEEGYTSCFSSTDNPRESSSVEVQSIKDDINPETAIVEIKDHHDLTQSSSKQIEIVKAEKRKEEKDRRKGDSLAWAYKLECDRARRRFKKDTSGYQAWREKRYEQFVLERELRNDTEGQKRRHNRSEYLVETADKNTPAISEDSTPTEEKEVPIVAKNDNLRDEESKKILNIIAKIKEESIGGLENLEAARRTIKSNTVIGISTKSTESLSKDGIRTADSRNGSRKRKKSSPFPLYQAKNDTVTEEVEGEEYAPYKEAIERYNMKLRELQVGSIPKASRYVLNLQELSGVFKFMKMAIRIREKGDSGEVDKILPQMGIYLGVLHKRYGLSMEEVDSENVIAYIEMVMDTNIKDIDICVSKFLENISRRSTKIDKEPPSLPPVVIVVESLFSDVKKDEAV